MVDIKHERNNCIEVDVNELVRGIYVFFTNVLKKERSRDQMIACILVATLKN